MKRIIITLSLLTALSLPAVAAEEGERPERPQRPDAAEVAKDWVTQHDANGNGALEEAELTAAFTAARENRPERPQMGNRQHQRQRAPEGAERLQRPPRPQREPGQMVGNIIERFDKDGDASLNEAELKEALGAMHKMQRRGPRGPRGPMQDRWHGKAPKAESGTEG